MPQATIIVVWFPTKPNPPRRSVLAAGSSSIYIDNLLVTVASTNSKLPKQFHVRNTSKRETIDFYFSGNH